MTDARKHRRSFLKLTAATGGVAGTMIVTGRTSAQTAGDPAKAGDLLLHQDGPNKGKAVKASELKVGVAADPKTKNPHDPLKGGVVLVKLASGRIQASSKPISYSAICTHQGCPIKEIGTIGGGTGNINGQHHQHLPRRASCRAAQNAAWRSHAASCTTQI
ncbi:twin-arginine translocation signal domain-containing protein [Deinococcus sp.]|uniref:twin-arginine translocation signal domain-containing protein n=1 Tax=Deinococcus sp. TaxID=47478 RepID=UPI002869B23C|nr:twin-arginine translocation signal domain-containing protein [Deinococcus sp.]